MNENTTSSMEMSGRNEIKAAVNEAVQTVGKSFENLCLLAGVEALTTMTDDDVNELAGEAYGAIPASPAADGAAPRAAPAFTAARQAILKSRLGIGRVLMPIRITADLSVKRLCAQPLSAALMKASKAASGCIPCRKPFRFTNAAA